MIKRRLFWICTLVALYAVTWIGGWISHAQQLQERAEEGYRFYLRENDQMESQSRKDGFPCRPIELWPQGPTSRIYWCVPMLPGILLADSTTSVGPLHAGGGVKIVIYYGVGSVELPTPWSWAA